MKYSKTNQTRHSEEHINSVHFFQKFCHQFILAARYAKRDDDKQESIGKKVQIDNPEKTGLKFTTKLIFNTIWASPFVSMNMKKKKGTPKSASFQVSHCEFSNPIPSLQHYPFAHRADL